MTDQPDPSASPVWEEVGKDAYALMQNIDGNAIARVEGFATGVNLDGSQLPLHRRGAVPAEVPLPQREWVARIVKGVGVGFYLWAMLPENRIEVPVQLKEAAPEAVPEGSPERPRVQELVGIVGNVDTAKHTAEFLLGLRKMDLPPEWTWNFTLGQWTLLAEDKSVLVCLERNRISWDGGFLLWLACSKAGLEKPLGLFYDLDIAKRVAEFLAFDYKRQGQLLQIFRRPGSTTGEKE